MKPSLLAVLLLLAGCQANQDATQTAAPLALDDERARASYLVGLDVARTLEPIKHEIDLAVVEAAVRRALAGEPALLDEAAQQATRQAFATRLRTQRSAALQTLAENNRTEGEAFLATNAQRANVHRTASGLQYEVLHEGSGARPQDTDTVRIDYIGALLDGREFENTHAIDHPAEFALNQAMPGWREGLALMPVGSKYRFWVPSELAYGEQGVPGSVGPNATLVFEVELLAIADRP